MAGGTDPEVAGLSEWSLAELAEALGTGIFGVATGLQHECVSADPMSGCIFPCCLLLSEI